MASDNPSSRFDKVLGDSTPLYAVVGLGDFAVERIREARVKLDATSLREHAQAKLSAGLDAVQADVKTAPEQVMDLPIRLQAALADAISGTAMMYADFANRGRELLMRARQQEPTDDLGYQAEAADSSTAEATPAAAKKSAKTTGTSAKRTPRAAKAAADSPKEHPKAATPRTRKSAAAAQLAGEDTAQAKQARDDAADQAGD